MLEITYEIQHQEVSCYHDNSSITSRCCHRRIDDGCQRLELENPMGHEPSIKALPMVS